MLFNSHSGNIYVPGPHAGWRSIFNPRLAYSPAQDYKSHVLGALLLNGCQFCLKRMAGFTKGKDSRMCYAHGFKICMGCLKEHTTSKTLLPPLPLERTC